ncbi:MAG: type VI secretion system tube protein Hcp [Terracidiphilus sp.]|jgi:type VI secretion system Hcp family effector
MRLGNVKRHVVGCVLASALLPAIPAIAAVNAYMTINGSKQGQLKGEAMSEKIALTSVSHDSAMATGIASGKRQHSSITIRKEVDAASPKLMQAMNTHEPLDDVTIVFPATGAGKAVQTISLKDAVITAVQISGRTETITIEYPTVQVTWTDGGKTGTDDWEVPK